eukprot:gene3924-4470_t
MPSNLEEIERRGNVVERGNEELHFLLFQHGNAGNYTRSLWVVPKGESFVAHQGLLIVLDQVEKGSRWFGKVLSSEEVDLCLDVEGIHDDIDFDNVDSEDDSIPLDEQDDIDENSLTVKEDLLKTLNRKYNIAYTQQEGKFPLDICQSLFEGRNGSNTWMFINLLFANTFCRLCFVADGASQLSDSKVSLIENSIRNGNLLYDRFVEASGTSQLPNIDDACEFIIREEIFACVESLHDIEVSDGDDIGQCIDKLRNSSKYMCCILIYNERSTVFLVDPYGGLVYFDSHRNGEHGCIICWTKTRHFRVIKHLVPLIRNFETMYANLAIVSFSF